MCLPGDHEGGEVGGVDGQEHHRKQGPHGRHKPGRQRGIYILCIRAGEGGGVGFLRKHQFYIIIERVRRGYLFLWLLVVALSKNI